MSIPRSVPESLARSTLAMRGLAGAEWLERLPSLVAECEHRWSLEAGSPFDGLSVNWVAPAMVRGAEASAVLKLAFPHDKEFVTEAAALETFDGRGAVRLLRLDLERGAMLLEGCEPGASLLTVDDDVEATAIAARVMERLWRPAPPGHPFPFVSDWARGLARLRRRYGGGTGPLPAGLVEEAEALFARLIPSQDEPLLLHGDLHRANVLSARREPWLAIDPKGLVGEPAYDAATLLREPSQLLEAPRPGVILERRLERLSADLGLERARLRGWALAQSVLAACWSLEDVGRVWDGAIHVARLLAEIRA